MVGCVQASPDVLDDDTNVFAPHANEASLSVAVPVLNASPPLTVTPSTVHFPADVAHDRIDVDMLPRFCPLVTVSPETKAHLELIGEGNRSAAIEMLVTDYLRRRKRAGLLLPEPVA